MQLAEKNIRKEPSPEKRAQTARKKRGRGLQTQAPTGTLMKPHKQRNEKESGIAKDAKETIGEYGQHRKKIKIEERGIGQEGRSTAVHRCHAEIKKGRRCRQRRGRGGGISELVMRGERVFFAARSQGEKGAATDTKKAKDTAGGIPHDCQKGKGISRKSPRSKWGG